MRGCMWGTAASVTRVFPLGYGSGETPASLPTHSLQISQCWPHQLTPLSFSLVLSIHCRSFAVSLLSLSLSGWMAVFSLSAWDLLGLKLTSLADLLWRRISAQRDSAANVLVRVQRSFQIKKAKNSSMLCWWTAMEKWMFSWSYTTAVHADED